MLEIRTVRHVYVNVKNGIPGIEQSQHRMHLGRIRLHVIAIEIEVLRGGAPPHLLWPGLVGAIPMTEALVSVNVEDRYEHQDEVLQSTLIYQELPQSEQPGVFAIDFAGVDASLHQHHRQAAPPRLFGIQCAGSRSDQREHGPAFRSTAEFHAFDEVRPRPRVGPAESLYFVIVPGAKKFRLLGDRLECRLRR